MQNNCKKKMMILIRLRPIEHKKLKLIPYPTTQLSGYENLMKTN